MSMASYSISKFGYDMLTPQEDCDGACLTHSSDGNCDVHGRIIHNVGDPKKLGDAVNLRFTAMTNDTMRSSMLNSVNEIKTELLGGIKDIGTEVDNIESHLNEYFGGTNQRLRQVATAIGALVKDLAVVRDESSKHKTTLNEAIEASKTQLMMTVKTLESIAKTNLAAEVKGIISRQDMSNATLKSVMAITDRYQKDFVVVKTSRASDAKVLISRLAALQLEAERHKNELNKQIGEIHKVESNLKNSISSFVRTNNEALAKRFEEKMEAYNALSELRLRDMKGEVHTKFDTILKAIQEQTPEVGNKRKHPST